MLDVFNDNHDIMLQSFQNLDTPLLQDHNIVLNSMPIEKTKKQLVKKLIMNIGQATCRTSTVRPGAMLLFIAKMSGADVSITDF